MDIGGRCRVEVAHGGDISGHSVNIGYCHVGLLKIVKFELSNLSLEDLEIHVQSSRGQEILFLGDNDLLDESFNPDVGVSKHMAKMCENNTTLSANLSFAACCRPFIDLLALKLPAIADPGAVPVSLGNGKRTRAASGDGASANEDATCSPCYKSDSELGDCDGDRRYFFHDSTKLLALRPSVISKNRKLQQKQSGDASGVQVGEWRIQIAAKSSGHVYFVICPNLNNGVPSEESKMFVVDLKWKLQHPSSNVYSFRRALWARKMMHSIGNGEGDLMSAPLSVSRSMAKSFGELSQFTEDPQCNFFEMKCVGKMLVSLVSISPSTINFGDCNVGDFKSASINLTNISDTLAILVPYFESDTITLSVKHIILKPGQSSRVTIDYVVRIIDPAYSKTIMFVNLLAPLSELKLEIRARNADTHQMLLHDIFYKLYTYSGSRQTILYSSCCMFRCPTVRLFSIRNVFSEPLEMKLTADNGNEVSLFCLENIIIESDGDFLKALKAVKIHPFELRQDVASISSSRRNPAREKEKFNASLFKRDDITVTKDVNVESIVESITALYKISSDVSKAVTRMMIKATVNDSGCSPLPGEKGPVYNYTNSLISEINGDAEDHVVRQCEQYLDTFQKISTSRPDDKSDCFLRPIFTSSGTSVVKIPVGHTQHFIVVLSPSCCDSVDELDTVEFFNTIHLELLSVHRGHISDQFMKRDTINAESTQLPSTDLPLSVRTVPIHGFVTRSECVVMQKNINFGKTTIGDPPARKSVVLVNRSSIPLLFVVSKSRSIASAFMKLSAGGHRGVILPKSSRTIHISFKPSLSGNFEEILVVKNVFNPGNVESIIVKSLVVKPENFILLSSTSSVPPLDPLQIRNVVSSEVDGVATNSEDISRVLLEKSRDCALAAILAWVQSVAKDSIPPVYLGEIFVGETVETVITFKVRNLTLKKRNFIIDSGHSKGIVFLSTNMCPFEAVPDTLDSVCSMICTFKEEKELAAVQSLDFQSDYHDKLEKLKQDLKKAQRKNKYEKIAKIQCAIQKIEDILNGGNNFNIQYEMNMNSDIPAHECSNKNAAETLLSKNLEAVLDSSLFHFQLDPEKEISLSVILRFIPGKSFHPWNGIVLPLIGQLRVFENKNEDLIKSIFFSAIVHSHRPKQLECILDTDLSIQHTIAYQQTKRSIDDALSVINVRKIHADNNIRLSEDVENTKLFIAEVSNWCSCQTNLIFPRYGKHRKTHDTSCKLVQATEKSIELSTHSATIFRGSICLTSMICAQVKLILWLENVLGDFSDNEYISFLPSEHGTLFVSVMTVQAEVPCMLEVGKELACIIALTVDKGDSISVLLEWTPSPRVITDLKFVALLGLKMETISNSVIKDGAAAGISDESCLYIPVLGYIERITSIRLEKYLNLADVPLGSVVRIESLIHNINEKEALHYVIKLVDSSVSSGHSGHITLASGSVGVIGPGDSSKLEVFFSALAIGKYEQELVVANINDLFDQKRILVSANITMQQSNFVIFPDVENLADNGHGAGMHFNLGFIQCAASSAKLEYSYVGEENCRPFRISNVCDKTLYVTAHSNLKKQCFIYTDISGSSAVSSMLLAPGMISTVYISIKRSLHNVESALSTLPGKSPTYHESKIEHMRDIVGGIRFLFYEAVVSTDVETSKNGYSEVKKLESVVANPALVKLFETRPIQIKAVLGCSLMLLHSPISMFRCVPICHRGGNRMFRGEFHIQNRSRYFRLRYTYVGVHFYCFPNALPCNKRDVESIRETDFFRVTVPSGEIKFLLLDSSENFVEPGCTECVEYLILFSDVKGLYTKTIDVLNVVTGDKQNLDLNFFFDPQRLVSSTSSAMFRAQSDVSSKKPTHNFNYGFSICTKDISGIKYAEGVFVTAVDSVRCKYPLWIDRFSDGNATPVPDNRQIQVAEEDRDIRGSDIVNAENDLSYRVLGCTDSNGYMCEWTLHNPLSTAVRVKPVSNLPLFVTTKALLSLESGLAQSAAANIAKCNQNHSTVKRNHLVASSELFSSFALNQSKVKVMETFDSECQVDRYLDRSKSIVTLPADLWQKDLRHCGDTFSINPGEYVIVRVYCEVGGVVPKKISKVFNKKVDMGSITDADGIVAFVSAPQTVSTFFTNPVQSNAAKEAEITMPVNSNDILDIFGFVRVKCRCVTPCISVPCTNIVHENLRPGQAFSFDVEVFNDSDVDVPVALKNLPEWMKIEKFQDAFFFGSSTMISARSSFKFHICIISVPGGQAKETVLRHDLYVCNMCRAFSAPNCERISVEIELHVQPAVALQIADEIGWLPPVKDDMSHFFFTLGDIELPFCATRSISSKPHNIYPDNNSIGLQDLSINRYVSDGGTFVFSMNEANSSVDSSESSSITLRVRNALSQCVHIDIELTLNESLRNLLVVKILYQGGVVPVQSLDMLPGECTEFTVVTSRLGDSNFPHTVTLPLYSSSAKQRTSSRGANLSGRNKSVSIYQNSTESDSSSSSGASDTDILNDDCDVSDSEESDNSIAGSFIISPGHDLTIAGELDYTSRVSESRNYLTILSVYAGQILLRPQAVGIIKTCDELNIDEKLDVIKLDLLCNVALPLMTEAFDTA